MIYGDVLDDPTSIPTTLNLLNPLIANLLIDYFEVQKWSICMNFIYAYNFLCSVERIPGPEIIPGSETDEVKAKSQQDKVC